MSRLTFSSYLAQYRILLLLAAMSEGPPKSARELAEAVDMDKSGVPAYLAHMGARVADWHKPEVGNLVPLYDMQPLPSVKRPKPLTAHQRKAGQWQRIKADPVRHERVKALQRLRRRSYDGGITMVVDGAVIISVS